MLNPLSRTPPGLRKRAKPLLGTVVEIALNGVDEVVFIRATNAAFARVETIHQAMSFHECAGDLTAIARANSGDAFSVSPDTWKTLALALDMEARSGGIFNPTIAPELVKRGLLPTPTPAHTHAPFPTSLPIPNDKQIPQQSSLKESISLEENFYVRIHKAVWIDLGGIAKGYAVDAAVDALIAHEVPHGIVNAGGDLRAFGDVEHAVSVRIPSAPHTVLPIASLRNLSCATTARYYAADVDGAIVGVRSAAAINYDSVSVIAPCCAVADALTKVLWLGDPHSLEIREMLRHFKANAALLKANAALLKANATPLDSAGIVCRL